MKKKILIGSIIAVVILTMVSFSSVVGYQSVRNNQDNVITDELDFEYCKDYLFETIIEIANNPEAKELINSNNHNLFSTNSNHRNIFPFIRNTNKPSIEHLDFLYKMGLKMNDKPREEKVSEILASVEIANPDVIGELDKLIMNDEELSERIYTLNEMNGDLISNMDFSGNPIICGILGIISLAGLFFYFVFGIILDFLYGINELLVTLFFFIAMPIWGPSFLITLIAMNLFRNFCF